MTNTYNLIHTVYVSKVCHRKDDYMIIIITTYGTVSQISMAKLIKLFKYR